MYYADTSALAKLVVTEKESSILRAWVMDGSADLAVSELARTELIRATRRSRLGASVAVRARDVLSRVYLVAVTTTILDTAAVLEPVEVRSLDAIHLATALTMGDDLDAVVTYDVRMGDAAASLGLRVIAPA